MPKPAWTIKEQTTYSIVRPGGQIIASGLTSPTVAFCEAERQWRAGAITLGDYWSIEEVANRHPSPVYLSDDSSGQLTLTTPFAKECRATMNPLDLIDEITSLHCEDRISSNTARRLYREILDHCDRLAEETSCQ